MELLRAAVVDITALVATCHALRSCPPEGDLAVERKLRNQLRREMKRATVAYIGVLARPQRGEVDDALLAACRVAAEQHMGRALRYKDLLSRIMASEPGSMEGVVASRQDLWRLAHMGMYLRVGIANLRESGDSNSTKSAGALASRLRRRIRKALVAYAQAILRTRKPEERLIVTARKAALAEIGERGAAEARRLAEFEVGSDSQHDFIRLGVAKPLSDLALDWQRRDAVLTGANGTGSRIGQNGRGTY
jgi:hypothetical protein